MKHLIIGATGLVGHHLFHSAVSQGDDAFGTGLSFSNQSMIKLDIRDPIAVKKVCDDVCPEVVYITAKMGGVDFCEENPKQTFAVNVIGVKNIIDAANHIDAKVVFFSSDYVFDGEAGPYREDDIPNPICEYGRQKVIAEHLVLQQAINPLIIRTTVVYGVEPQKKNFVYTLLRSFQMKNPILVPSDQIGTPTYAPSLAHATIELVRKDAQGVYNLVGKDLVNRYQFAIEVARKFIADENLIQPVDTASLNQLAARPLRAGLLTEKAERIINIPMTGYSEALANMETELRLEK